MQTGRSDPDPTALFVSNAMDVVLRGSAQLLVRALAVRAPAVPQAGPVGSSRVPARDSSLALGRDWAADSGLG